jgi:hypothetical protein
MVSHCANPNCHRPFRSLKQGRLVVLPPSRNSAAANSARLDVAWLCDGCAGSFLVARGEDGRLQVARVAAIAA